MSEVDLLGSPVKITTRQLEVLASLQKLFHEHGFLRFTLDDLAGELTCSKSTLYALASSKEQLSVLVVRTFFVEATEHVERRIARCDRAQDKIQAYLDGVRTELERAGRPFIRDIIDFAPTRAVYERNARAAADRVHDLIGDGVAAGEFRAVHAELIATMAGVLVQNIQAGVIAERTGASHAEAFTALSELLLDGLRKR